MSYLRKIEENSDVVSVEKPWKPAAAQLIMELMESDLDLSINIAKELETKPSSKSSCTQRASRPERSYTVYLVNPKSNFKPNIHKPLQVGGDRRERIEKSLKRLKAAKKKPMQALKVSAQGRGIFF